MTFHIASYIGAGPIHFGATIADVFAAVGPPTRRTTTYRGDEVFDYDNFNVGFDKSGRVSHLGFLPGSKVVIDKYDVFAKCNFKAIMLLDGAPMEVVGLIVLLNLGLAFSGFHDDDDSQLSVTVFRRGTYDRLEGRMRPFDGGGFAP